MLGKTRTLLLSAAVLSGALMGSSGGHAETALNALFRIQFIFLERFQQRRGHTGRHAAFETTSAEKIGALPDNSVGGINVEPEEPFRCTAERDTQLIDGQTFSQALDIGVRPKARIFLNDPFDMPAGVEHTDRVKIETLGLGNSEHRRTQTFGDKCRHGVCWKCDATRPKTPTLVEFRSQRAAGERGDQFSSWQIGGHCMKLNLKARSCSCGAGDIGPSDRVW